MRVSNGNQRNGPVTTCKVCRRSIFDAEQRQWVTTPNPGLAHVVCVPKAAA